MLLLWVFETYFTTTYSQSNSASVICSKVKHRIHVTPYSTPALNENTIYHIRLCPHSVVSPSRRERYNKQYNPMQIANRIANTKFDCGMATSGMPVFIQFLFPPSFPSFRPPSYYFPPIRSDCSFE